MVLIYMEIFTQKQKKKKERLLKQNQLQYIRKKKGKKSLKA